MGLEGQVWGLEVRGHCRLPRDSPSTVCLITHSNHELSASGFPDSQKPSGLCLCINVPPPRSKHSEERNRELWKRPKPAVSTTFFCFPWKVPCKFPSCPQRGHQKLYTGLFMGKSVTWWAQPPIHPRLPLQGTCSALLCPQHFQSAWWTTRKGLWSARGIPTLCVWILCPTSQVNCLCDCRLKGNQQPSRGLQLGLWRRGCLEQEWRGYYYG